MRAKQLKKWKQKEGGRGSRREESSSCVTAPDPTSTRWERIDELSVENGVETVAVWCMTGLCARLFAFLLISGVDVEGQEYRRGTHEPGRVNELPKRVIGVGAISRRDLSEKVTYLLRTY